MNLTELQFGENAVIIKVKGIGAFRKRLLEMGFVPGKEIRIVNKAPLLDPVEYNVMGYNVSLRNSEAKLVEIVSESDIINTERNFNGTSDSDISLLSSFKEKGKHINVAFVGNPNSGKTTIFNSASGSHERVGNYGGVTVEAKEAKFRLDGYVFHAIDLPGTYSLSAWSPEEMFVRDYIYQNIPDVVINVVDASNLERNLYLTTQLIDMDIKVVVALNMFDELQKKGDRFKHEYLSKMVGVPFIPMIASKNFGIDNLLQKIIEVYEDRDPIVRTVNINYGANIERSIEALRHLIDLESNNHITAKISPRFAAIKLLEKDKLAEMRIAKCSNYKEIHDIAESEIKRLESELIDDSESLITDAKYGFIAGALKETLVPGVEKRRRKTDIIDTIITHKVWGIPIFVFLMWMMFFTTFRLGEYPKQWIETGILMLSTFVDGIMEEGMLKDLLIQGIIGGVGGVIVFLPNILLLYFSISLMEDTGYMARAVFIMDKAMHKIGLHGKSFIPLLMGFGCNVPAIMSTRIIESPRDRLVTILINPFMSCSARLPVYILFIGSFFTSYQGSILFIIYATGIMLAILSAMIFKRTIFKKSDVPFVMELPPYRLPTLKSIVKHMWYRSEQYLRKIAGVILLASIIIWALGYFPMNNELDDEYNSNIHEIEMRYDARIAAETDPALAESLIIEKETEIRHERIVHRGMMQENSYIGQIGKIVEPFMRPLGFDWKMSIGIITGVAAKEIVIGTLGVLYLADDVENQQSLSDKLKKQKFTSGPHKGETVISPLVAMSFMFFVLIYFPCIAVLVTISRESGSWKWAAFTVIYTTGLAWLVSFIVYQTGQLFF